MANNITLSQTDDIVIVTVSNNEQANTIDISFCEELLSALDDVEISQQYRAVILRAKGSVFSAGGDLAQILECLDKGDGSLEALISAFHAVILAIRRLPLPVIASVQGAAAGAGFSLAMACDAVVAANTAKFVVGYPRLGTSSDGGLSYQLTRRLGPARALDIFLRKEALSAAEAQSLGLVQRLTDPSSLEDTAFELAKTMSNHPSVTVAEIKSLIGALSDDGLEQHLEREKQAFLRCASMAGFRTSVAQFVQQSKARKH
ncbi:enoyl-CoA hydratase/isomerase family protein [Paraburkholderia nemoris]|jgi:2-(1,2-epoxy-1,2-dihydrophenyl)acetyl-CoA isomerase|uniref:enoyl-CoA hydratase/isomerase family protein n=1 Tax=Paraburkholderia nemoris TaxID=2793076 RepID=UPI0038BD7015